MIDPDLPNADFYEVGREYYFVGPAGNVIPIMTVVTGPAVFVKDPRTGISVWAHPTMTKGTVMGDDFYVYVLPGQLTPVERPSGEAKIFSEFVK